MSKFFNLPCNVGRIEPETFSSRAFKDVAIDLPDGKGEVFFCGNAVWRERDAAGHVEKELQLSDGRIILGNDQWARADYRQVLESGLSHDFLELGLRRVGMERFDIAFNRGGFSIHCRQALGVIDMTNPSEGVATLTAYEVNGATVSQGVRIMARFLPTRALSVKEIILDFPPLPLAAVGLVPSLGGMETGRFAGHVQYLAQSSPPEVWLNGDLDDLNLADMDSLLPIGPLKGKLSVRLDRARFENGRMTEFHGRGHVEELSLAPIAPLLNQESIAGTAALQIDAIDIVRNQLVRLALRGDLEGLAVEEWLHLVGKGTATGRLFIRVNSLELEGSVIKSGDIEIKLKPPAGGSGTLDRELLLEAAQHLLSFTWPSTLPQEILPEKVPYVEFGARLIVNHNRLRILGSHGENDKTILTVRVFGRPFGVVKDQAGTIDLTPMLESLANQMHGYTPDELREWWQLVGRRSSGD